RGRAGAASGTPRISVAHRPPGPTGPILSLIRAAIVEPTAATNTRPIRPIPRPTSTIVLATVFEPASRAVSRMRMTSPPIFDGRKLLKNVATRYDERSE